MKEHYTSVGACHAKNGRCFHVNIFCLYMFVMCLCAVLNILFSLALLQIRCNSFFECLVSIFKRLSEHLILLVLFEIVTQMQNHATKKEGAVRDEHLYNDLELTELL